MAPKQPDQPPSAMPPGLQHLIQQGTDSAPVHVQEPMPPHAPPSPPIPQVPADQPVPVLEGPGGFALFGQMLTDLVGAMKSSQMSPETLKDILMETGKVNAEVARKARWPENATHPGISAYFTAKDMAVYGALENKPKLNRTTFFCDILEEEERLTPTEIEAFNKLDKPSECRGGAWRAVIIRPKAVGGKEELRVHVPKDTVDQRMVLPSLLLILHELAGGPSTENVYALMKQIEYLKAQLVSAKVGGTSVADLEAHLAAL